MDSFLSAQKVCHKSLQWAACLPHGSTGVGMQRCTSTEVKAGMNLGGRSPLQEHGATCKRLLNKPKPCLPLQQNYPLKAEPSFECAKGAKGPR